MTNTLEPTLSAQLVATLIMGVSLAVLQVAQWYDVRRNFRTRCDEVISEVRRLREDSRDGI